MQPATLSDSSPNFAKGRRFGGTVSSSSLFDSAADMVFKNFPPEILSKIFELTIEEEDDALEMITPDRDSQPLALLRVCKRWRAVALMTKSLWNKVWTPNFQERYPKVKSERMETFDTSLCDLEPQWDPIATVKFVSAWLRVSYPSPLTLVHAPQGYPTDPKLVQAYNDFQNRMVDALVVHEGRWSSLDIELDELLLEIFHYHLRTGAAGKAPLGKGLRTLKISFQPRRQFINSNGSVIDIFLWIASLPDLETLDLILLNDEGWEDIIALLPFEGLKNFKFKRLCASLEEIMEIIPRCTSATELAITMRDYDSLYHEQLMMSIPTSGHSLSSLTRLIMDKAPRPLDVLRIFDLPNLRVLRIRCGLSDHDERCKILQDFLNRCQCPLESFQAFDPWLSATQALEMFMLPALRPVQEVAFAWKTDQRTSPIMVEKFAKIPAFSNDSGQGTSLPPFTVWVQRFEDEVAMSTLNEEMVSDQVLREQPEARLQATQVYEIDVERTWFGRRREPQSVSEQERQEKYTRLVFDGRCIQRIFPK
ncbi:hypothetical protein CVT26_003998 [Gymnopilus dilepis]|uniref:Uncharacterized protein n=1 Tax=Gymnopilus dilepis TaxID=231916 RepID=A0A409WTU7_9AGAR|nr:hypothetical protein CVT26_003998 [Gymnopilus dilepis]